MAETVEQILERQIPSLQDLVDRRIMTVSEVKSLVEQRRSFEYRLARRAARKVDFLRYVEYELKVDALRKLRKDRLKLVKQTTSDFAQVAHVFFIFERGVRKFQADPDLWLQFIDFAVSQRAEKRLSTLFPRALQLHPRHTALWLRAAEWQAHELGNTTAARVLFQRALRLNPTAEALWLEYFRLEWGFIKKLGARRTALGLNPQADAFYLGAVPLTVYESATAALPLSLKLRVDFLRLCGDFERSEAVQTAILASIARNFKASPEAWAVRAAAALGAEDALTAAGEKKKKRRLEALGEADRLSAGEVAAVVVLEQGVAELSAQPAMWQTYADFLCRRWARAVAQSGSGSGKAALLASRLDALLQRGHVLGALPPSLVLTWSRLPAVGPGRAEAILRQGLAQAPAAVELWQALLQLRAWAAAANAASEPAAAAAAEASGSLEAALEEALAALGGPRAAVEVVALLYQPLLEASLADPPRAHRLFTQAFKRCPGQPPATLAAQYVRWAFGVGAHDGAAQAYRSVCAAYPGGAAALVPCALECASLLGDAAEHAALVRSAFEAAVRWGAATAWERYAAWEQRRGDPAEADAVRWRAQRA